ncbi:ubiE/COQ5 methyltransferase [Xylariaceae sp. FL0804]|nr:ubiE/COQ5 methyltransferase [Xylariaceae sp. FL0804]
MSTERATYTHGHHASVVAAHAQRTAQDSAAFLLPHLRATDKVLDLGCGPGSITCDLAALVPLGSVVGGDAAASVLDGARRLAASRGLGNVRFEEMDGNALPFADGEFDVVFCHQVLQHVADPAAVLREMLRVCRKGSSDDSSRGGGIVAAREADYGSFAWSPMPPALDRWAALYARCARAGGGEPDAGRRLRGWALAAGFERGPRLALSWDSWLYQGEGARAWGEAWRERALHSGFADAARREGLLLVEKGENGEKGEDGEKGEEGEKGEKVEEELREISRAWGEWAEDEDAFINVPCGQILYEVP